MPFRNQAYHKYYILVRVAISETLLSITEELHLECGRDAAGKLVSTWAKQDLSWAHIAAHRLYFQILYDVTKTVIHW